MQQNPRAAGQVLNAENPGVPGIIDDERWDLRILSQAVGYQRWILSAFGDAIGGRVLEVGAGNGNFTRWLVERADSVVALEPDQEMCNDLRLLALPGVDARCRTLEDEASCGPFDCAVIINVLEHIKDDVAALRTLAGMLAPGGKACILVPAHQWLYAPIDRRFGHFRRYRRQGLNRAIDDAGMKPVVLRYFNPIGALGWLAMFKVLRRRRLSPGSVATSERVLVPLGRRLERFVRPPFGQSLVAVAERKEA